MKTAFLTVAIMLVAQLSQSQKVGIGNTNPGYILDVSGRMRLRHVDANNTSGLWFNKANNTEGVFTGMINDSTIGFFGNGTVGNWRVGIDVKNAMLGIGNVDPTAPLSFDNNIGNKIDIYHASPTVRYGIGLQSGVMQLYSGSAADDIAFGYGSSAMFTENMRVKGNGNVGIGVTNPTLAGLQVNTKVGGVNAMFGSNTTGIAIETASPGIGFNSYYNGSRKIINTGYGGLVGLDPSNGRFYIFSSPASVTGQGTSLDIMERLSILPNGNVGIGNAAPTAPLSFDNNVGNKIDFYNGSATDRYGIALQPGVLELYSGGNFAFGRGTGANFIERMRINVTTLVGETEATLHVLRGTGLYGTAQFDGTTYISHFNYGTVEDTYIRGGKATSKVVINDQSTGAVLISPNGGNVGIGTAIPAAKLDVAGTFQTSSNATIGGTIKIAGGSPTNGAVLTSTNGTGAALWVKPAINGSAFYATIGNSNQELTGGSQLVNYTVSDPWGVFSDGFDNATHTFIAPETGVYHFDAKTNFNSSGAILNYGGYVTLTALQDGNVVITESMVKVQEAGSYEQNLSITVVLFNNETIQFKTNVGFCCGPFYLRSTATSLSGFRLY